MRQIISLETKKLDLMQAIMSVETDYIIDKVAKYLLRITKISEAKGISEETLSMMEQSRKEYKEGKVVSFNSASEAQQWLEAL